MTRHRAAAAAAAAVMAFVMAAGFPAAEASYTGSYAPAQVVKPHQLVTPSSFACTTPGSNSVALTWADADATTANPYSSTFWATGYVVERKVNSGSYSTIATPARTATGFTDSSFPLLALGDVLSYRMHSTKSTNWVSSDSAVVTAHVTSLLVFVHVSCP